MSTKAVEQLATGNYVRISAYDSTKWNLGTIINQFTDSGVTYIGPNNLTIARPLEEGISTLSTIRGLEVISQSDTIDNVFLFEAPSAANTMRIILYEYNRVLSTYNCKGFITVTFNTAATHTIKAVQMGRYLHTTGTVSVSSTAVSGTSTLFTTDRIAVGARIGFGSTDPTAITDWYPISAITNDTTLTIARSAGTIGAGTSYVIEELRAYVVTTNSTAANGGLFAIKGINYNDFNISGTTISASASTADNLKLGYWLADASSVTNTSSIGCALDAEVSKTTHYLYVLDGTASPIKMYRYNVRANDSITSGKMVLSTSNVLVTATQAITGTPAGSFNLDIATTSHGPGSGIKSLYFTTTTRFYRTSISNITSGNTNWISDSRNEVPPGGVNTYAATSKMNGAVYLSDIDAFFIPIAQGSANRNYVTKYPNTSGDKFTHVFGLDGKQLNQAAADSTNIPRFDGNSTEQRGAYSNGILHIQVVGNTSTTQVYALPIGAHWTYASTTNQRAISPSISTPNCSEYIRFYMNVERYIGSGNISEIAPEGIRAYYRTNGITDNTGDWVLLSSNGDLSSAPASSTIQFMFEFKTVGTGLLLPGRLLSFAVLYDDFNTISQYQPSVSNSSTTNKRFAWRFSTAFGTTVPTLRIRLYEEVSGGIIIDDTTTSSSYGTWEKSTNDGSTWGSYNTTDKANETTYIRYTPTSLPDNIKIRALLTLN